MDGLYRRYLSENWASGKFPFTPQGIADCVDDALGRAVYESVSAVYASLDADVAAVDRFHDEGGPVPPDGDA